MLGTLSNVYENFFSENQTRPVWPRPTLILVSLCIFLDQGNIRDQIKSIYVGRRFDELFRLSFDNEKKVIIYNAHKTKMQHNTMVNSVVVSLLIQPLKVNLFQANYFLR